MLIKKLILLFKRLFNKENSLKMIESQIRKDEKNNFVNSLKVDIIKKNNKKKVETLTCFGDGLGIQTKISC